MRIIPCFVLVVVMLATAARAADRPNILWISAEDLSPDFGCYGDTFSTTPNLDRLASQGVRFDRAFSTAPVCSPSRTSMATGMYASSIGGQHHRSSVPLPQGVRVFPAYLRDLGYYTTNHVKTDYNFPMPKDAWDQNGPNAHYKNRPTKDTPFFAVFNFTTTHESRCMGGGGDEGFETLKTRHDPAKVKLPAYYPDTPVVRATWARWYDLISVLDNQVKEVLDELEKEGLADNTIVMFWGDHGRGLPRGKRWAYDSGLRVPLIVRWPKHVQPNSVRQDLVTLMDLGPTLISLAGGTPPANMQGRVILGDKTQPEPQYVFATRDRMDEVYDMQRTARDRQYRYIKNFRPDLPYSQIVAYQERSPIWQEWRRLAAANELTGPAALFMAKTKPAEELYDLNADPDEIHNLAADPAQKERLTDMRAAVEEWMTRIHDQGTKPEPQDNQKASRQQRRRNAPTNSPE